MQVKVVTLQYAAGLGGFDERPLAAFVRDKQVLEVREHFFTVHELPHLACLITWQPPAARDASPDASTPRTGGGKRTRSGRDDPTADLAEDELALYATLREWRTRRARKDGVPPYVLFTNRELVAIVRARPSTPSALMAVEGVGTGKVERHGEEVLAMVTPRKMEDAHEERTT